MSTEVESGAKGQRSGESRRVEVIAHRGFSGAAPENTLAAFRAAIALGADRVELDVQLSRDGRAVVIHDAELDRTTTGRGPVADRTLAEIRSLDAGSWFHPRFAAERVPTLEEALEECRGRILVNVEIKAEAVDARPGERPGGVEARVLEAIRGLGLTGAAVVSSFEPLALRRLRKASPEVLLQSLYEKDLHRSLGPAAVCKQVGSRAFNCGVEEVNPLWIEEAHRAGLRLNVYTADEPELMERLISLGVDGIFTNHPDRLLRLLGRAPAQRREGR